MGCQIPTHKHQNVWEHITGLLLLAWKCTYDFLNTICLHCFFPCCLCGFALFIPILHSITITIQTWPLGGFLLSDWRTQLHYLCLHTECVNNKNMNSLLKHALTNWKGMMMLTWETLSRWSAGATLLTDSLYTEGFWALEHLPNLTIHCKTSWLISKWFLIRFLILDDYSYLGWTACARWYVVSLAMWPSLEWNKKQLHAVFPNLHWLQ